MEVVRVELGPRSYDIFIGSGILESAGALIATLNLNGAAAVVSNTTVAPLYGPKLLASLDQSSIRSPMITVRDGERYKTLTSIARIYSGLIRHGLDRNSFLIALGGGVVGDMGGFAAATYMRGIPFIQVPTTLLSQVDSSVGGKTGVNLKEGKNLAGAFHQPLMVIIDPLVLKSLEDREMRSGMAEVIKTSILGEADFFSYLESHMQTALSGDPATLTRIITACCRIKAGITSRDETEQGIRAHLNLGHTIGHAIEALTGFSTYAHGEAVSIGIASIARLSAGLGLCPRQDALRIVDGLKSAQLPVDLPDFTAQAYVDAMLRDKKKTAGSIKMVLIRSIGSVFLQTVSSSELLMHMSSILQNRSAQ